MNYLLVIADGMADYPVDSLGGKTPLQVANKPNLDMLASKGRSGILRTIPENMNPGSVVANLSILGYNPKRYNPGRGSLEAAARNIHLSEGDIAFRCNLITEENGILADYSAGHITNDEANQLLISIADNLEKTGEIEFHVGVSYRHLLILRGGKYSDEISCTPPHDAVGNKILRLLPKAKTLKARYTVALLRDVIQNSQKILRRHPVNVNRTALGKRAGNMIWPWGPGKKPRMPTLQKKFGIKGAVISAVDLIKGIGVYAGMKIIDVPGVTGFYDTNYEGKADYALTALKNYNMILIHVEAPDEAGHSGDYKQKIRTIEDLDRRLIGRLLDNLDEETSIAIMPDHPTPVKIRTHTSDPVPFTIYSPHVKPDAVRKFDEICVKKGGFGLIEGPEFMSLFIMTK